MHFCRDHVRLTGRSETNFRKSFRPARIAVKQQRAEPVAKPERSLLSASYA
jgi:hypothetical protein